MNYLREFKNSGGTPYASRLLRILVAATTLVLCAHLLLQFLNLNVFHQQNGQLYELANRFDMDDESSVATWFAQVLFLAIGVFALLIMYLQKSKPPKRLWGTIASIGIIASIDEIAGLHERFLQSLHVLFFQDTGPTEFANAWLIIAPVVLVAGGWLAWKSLHILPRRTALYFVLAGLIFLSGAMFIDLLISAAPRETFLNQGILVAIEETLELLGKVVALYAIADYLERQHLALLRGTIHKLKM